MSEIRKRNKIKTALPGVILGVFCAVCLSFFRSKTNTLISIGGFSFAYTDIFVMIPAGIGGLGCGLLTFSILFAVELIRLNGNYLAVYSIATYLVLVLSMAFLTYRGWMRGIKKIAAACLLITVILSFCWWITFTEVIPAGDIDNAYYGVGYGQLFLRALPETLFSVILTAAFFHFAPDDIKILSGNGRAYLDSKNDGSRESFVLGNRITILSLLESLFLCIVAILCNYIFAAIDAGEVFTLSFMMSRWRTGVRLGLMIMCAAVPAAFVFNQYILSNVAVPINEMSSLMNCYFHTDERHRNRRLPNLDIHTGDEIEELYLSLRKMVADMGDYIDRELEQERRTAHMSKGFMMALAKAVDAKDRYTSGHSARVAKYSREIARRMGKSEKEQEDIYMMGLLHDIGKIGVPDAVINKPGRLDDEEFAMIKKHPATGAQILENVEELPGLAIGAHWHHERYDGKGYPDGLAGEHIPEEARIIAVADSYDAMTSNRSYRNVMPQEKVRAEVENCKGSQFDPLMADIMLSIIDDDKEYRLHE